ncbi:MAG: hypothetical protein ACK5MZ_02340 [Aestuariibaculum sp.]
MKTITPYLLRFALTITVLTLVFRFFLSYGIAHQSNLITILSAALYFMAMFASGWYFGQKDGEYLPIYDVGFRFHLTTYLVHTGITFLWILLGFGAEAERIGISVYIAVYWGIILLAHFVFYLWARKQAIDSLDKDDLFE